MNVKEYEDYKYVMGDTSNIYLGGKFTYQEMLDSDEVPFKFQSIIEHYLLKDTEPETSLESQFGKVTRSYQQKIYPLKEFVAVNLAQKKARGFVVQEIILSKLAVTFFNV